MNQFDNFADVEVLARKTNARARRQETFAGQDAPKARLVEGRGERVAPPRGTAIETMARSAISRRRVAAKLRP